MIKNSIKVTLEYLFAVLMLIPYFAQRIPNFLFHGNYANTQFARVINAGFWPNWVKADIYKRMSLQSIMMGGAKGVDWADHYGNAYAIFPPPRETMVGDIPFYEAWPFLDDIEKILNEPKSYTVVQLGASSGREIAYFAEKFEKVNFIYSDIFDSVVDNAKLKYSSLGNMRFVPCSADNLHIICEMSNQDNVLIFSNGSAQYVYPEHLDLMFSRLRNCKKNVEIFFLEPASTKLGSPLEISGSSFRGNFSYTHNYSTYAEKHGFSTKEWRIVDPYINKDMYPVHRNTVIIYGRFSIQPVVSHDTFLTVDQSKSKS